MFHHVLIGYDGSANGKKALEYGIDFAMHAGAELTIVTVFPKVPDYLGSPQYDEIAARMTGKATETAEMGGEQARGRGRGRGGGGGGGAPPPPRPPPPGPPPRAGASRAAGPRAPGELAGLLRGSVSARLAHHA